MRLLRTSLEDADDGREPASGAAAPRLAATAWATRAAASESSWARASSARWTRIRKRAPARQTSAASASPAASSAVAGRARMRDDRSVSSPASSRAARNEVVSPGRSAVASEATPRPYSASGGRLSSGSRRAAGAVVDNRTPSWLLLERGLGRPTRNGTYWSLRPTSSQSPGGDATATGLCRRDWGSFATPTGSPLRRSRPTPPRGRDRKRWIQTSRIGAAVPQWRRAGIRTPRR